MDNKILFRGRRLDNGAWVFGSYVAAPWEYGGGTAHLIVEQNCSYRGCGEFFWMDVHEVDPDTVGQCTGIKDDGGNLIFEHDILRCKSNYYPEDVCTTSVYRYGNTLCVDIDGHDFNMTSIDFADYEWEGANMSINIVGNMFDDGACI